MSGAAWSLDQDIMYRVASRCPKKVVKIPYICLNCEGDISDNDDDAIPDANRSSQGCTCQRAICQTTSAPTSTSLTNCVHDRFTSETTASQRSAFRRSSRDLLGRATNQAHIMCDLTHKFDKSGLTLLPSQYPGEDVETPYVCRNCEEDISDNDDNSCNSTHDAYLSSQDCSCYRGRTSSTSTLSSVLSDTTFDFCYEICSPDTEDDFGLDPVHRASISEEEYILPDIPESMYTSEFDDV